MKEKLVILGTGPQLHQNHVGTLTESSGQWDRDSFGCAQMGLYN